MPGAAFASPPLVSAPTPPSESLRPHPLASTATSSAMIDNHRMLSSLLGAQADAARQPDHTCRQHVHEEDQDPAVDHGRERLVDVGGVDGDELDEQRAEDRSGDGGEPRSEEHTS